MARKSRLMGVLAILLLIGGNPVAQASYTRQDLELIENMILTEQWATLYQYILLHPELLEGDGLLARELREFARIYKEQGIYLSGDVLSPVIIDELDNHY